MGPPPRPPTGNQNYGPQFQGANQQNSQAFFQYSQCNGKKKALCIGINYIGQKNELSGCINDANNIQRFLCRELTSQITLAAQVHDSFRLAWLQGRRYCDVDR